MNWEAIKIKANVQLRFLRDQRLSIQTGYLACPSKIDGFPPESMWDVRIKVLWDTVKKDEVVNTQITFLSPDIEEKYLTRGAKVELGEREKFAEGNITKLLY